LTTFAGRYGPWALIVGASAGIGAAAADEAARRGLNVVIVARRRRLLDERAAAMRAAHGVEVRIVAEDLAASGATDTIIEACLDVDVGTVVYNAAAEPRGRFLDTPLAEHVASIVVNCTVPTVLCHHFAGPMVGRGRGALVLVTSMGAFQGGSVFASYFAAKAYDWILAEGLWAELADAGVDALAYVVGATRTETYAGQKDGSSDPVAGAEDHDGLLMTVPEPGSDGSNIALARLRHPSDPQDVGRRIFDVLHAGPTVFSHPADEATAPVVWRLSRRDAVLRMSRLTTGIRH
jgi:short-subunit dehydrogenase